ELAAAHERSATECASTIVRLEANLAKQTAKIAELEQYGRDAELKLAQTQCSLLDSEKQKSQLVELQAATETELLELAAAHERSVAERDSTISRLKDLQKALDDSIRCVCVSKMNSTLAESRLQQCEQTVAQLGEQSTQLQIRLDREAASRRKTEAALKQAVESAKDNSALHALGEQFANVQRIERLTNELMATRRFCVYLQQQANSKAKQGQRGVQLCAPMPADMPRAAS
ncbi:MAG TPA: hypothetical protein VM260_26025, partial [Pirellula sp.]|nr:hypothetical protein [Pirellula sp.]